MRDDADLLRILSEIQRRGAIGRTTTLRDEIAHADGFVASLPDTVSTLVDLGSGGGLPGLVIAHRRRDIHVTLIERRAKRADLLRYGVRGLALEGSVDVAQGDAVDIASRWAALADVVTARSFGPMWMVLETAAWFTDIDGWALVSEPPGQVTELGASELSSGGWRDAGVTHGIHRFHRFHVEPRR
ncbi:MAG: class I SAM-dependent methyltransferase [Actinobacteria bacterium]|nr:class I SAM-dependent methyltransferase [Actinomycetota bacterium]